MPIVNGCDTVNGKIAAASIGGTASAGAFAIEIGLLVVVILSPYASRPLSPDLISANCVATGPNSSSTIRLPASSGAIAVVRLGYRKETVCTRPRPTSVIGRLPIVSSPACFQCSGAGRAHRQLRLP